MEKKAQKHVALYLSLTGISALVFLLALLLHSWVGQFDEGQIVLRPVGHLSPFLAFAWAGSVVVSSIISMICKSWWRLLPLTLAALSLFGVIVLFT